VTLRRKFLLLGLLSLFADSLFFTRDTARKTPPPSEANHFRGGELQRACARDNQRKTELPSIYSSLSVAISRSKEMIFEEVTGNQVFFN